MQMSHKSHKISCVTVRNNLGSDSSIRYQMTGATLKKKVTSVKHKPAGGIAKPGGLKIQ